MAKGIIAVSQFEFAQELAKKLSLTLSMEFIACDNASAVLDPILKGEEVFLLLLEWPAIGDPVSKYLSAVKNKTPVILYSDAQAQEISTDMQVLGWTTKANAFSKISSYVNLMMPPEVRKKATVIPVPPQEYTEIQWDLLKGSTTVKADLFIKEAPGKYALKFKAGDPLDATDLKVVYVKKEEAQLILDNISKALKEAAESNKKNEVELKEIAAAAHESIRDLVKRVGMTDEVRDLIKTNMVVTMKSMGSNPRLRNLIAKLIVDPTKYLSSHSVTLAQLSCALAAVLEWGSQTTFHKLTMASLLHDILVDDNELAKAQSKADVEALKEAYTDLELREYVLHPSKAALLVRTFTEVPPDTDTIIMQHHERPDGLGFPRGLTRSQLTPLSSVFIVAHDLVNFIFENKGKLDMEKFMSTRMELYNNGTNFKKIYAALKDIKL